MRKPKRIPRTCHMVVDSTRRNPYITCSREPVGDGNFCQEHLDYIDKADEQFRKLFAERNDGKERDRVDGADVEPGAGMQPRLPGVR
ncbi:MAG: hypothetical protein ACREIS_14785 [Nitrospiraceae bacterium]